MYSRRFLQTVQDPYHSSKPSAAITFKEKPLEIAVREDKSLKLKFMGDLRGLGQMGNGHTGHVLNAVLGLNLDHNYCRVLKKDSFNS